MVERQFLQLRCLLASAVRTLRRPQACDTRPYVGAESGVVVDQGVGERIIRQPLVVDEESVGRTGMAQALDVHGQEGHVGTDIAMAQPVGELDAIEYPDAVVEAEDVLGLEVTMPIAHTT